MKRVDVFFFERLLMLFEAEVMYLGTRASQSQHEAPNNGIPGLCNVSLSDFIGRSLPCVRTEKPWCAKKISSPCMFW